MFSLWIMTIRLHYGGKIIELKTVWPFLLMIIELLSCFIAKCLLTDRQE